MTRKRTYQCPTCGQRWGGVPIEPPTCSHGTKSNRKPETMKEVDG